MTEPPDAENAIFEGFLANIGDTRRADDAFPRRSTATLRQGRGWGSSGDPGK
jgi:hypothetical protein